MGIALGCIGLSLDDFFALTPEEFCSVCKAWQETRDALYRDSWERTRTHATILVQPHTKKQITARQLLPLPWDKVATRKGQDTEAPKETMEQRKARFEELKKRFEY